MFTTAADDRAAQLQLRTRDSTTETPFLTLDFSAGTADDIIRHLSSELRSLQLRFTDAVASGETSTAEVERQRQTIQHLSESTAKPTLVSQTGRHKPNWLLLPPHVVTHATSLHPRPKQMLALPPPMPSTEPS